MNHHTPPPSSGHKAIHVIGRAVIVDHDHILLTYHPRTEHLYTALPGGHVEWNEKAADALKRELLEETGLPFEHTEYLGVLEHAFELKAAFNGHVCHTHEYNFIFMARSSKLKYPDVPVSPESECAFKWVPLRNLEASKILPQSLRTLIPQLLSSPHKPQMFSQLL